MDDIIVAYITIPRDFEKEFILKLLKKRLVACVNSIDTNSFYWWENKIEKSEEKLLIIKTRKELLEDFINYVKEIHPYKIPEILIINPKYVDRDYQKWVNRETWKVFSNYEFEDREYKDVVAIVTYPITILVIHKKYSYISLPGGVVEEGESLEEALKRELKEEVGFEVKKFVKTSIETKVYSVKKKNYFRVITYVGLIDFKNFEMEDKMEGVILERFENINEEFLRWLNKKYYLSPNTLDSLYFRRKELEEFIKKL